MDTDGSNNIDGARAGLWAAAPVGLLGAAVIVDAAYIGAGNHLVGIAAFWLLALGIAGAIVTAPVWVMQPFLDGAPRHAGFAASINLLALMLFCASLGMRLASPEALDPPGLPHGLSFLGAALAVGSAWHQALPAVCLPYRRPAGAAALRP